MVNIYLFFLSLHTCVHWWCKQNSKHKVIDINSVSLARKRFWKERTANNSWSQSSEFWTHFVYYSKRNTSNAVVVHDIQFQNETVLHFQLNAKQTTESECDYVFAMKNICFQVILWEDSATLVVKFVLYNYYQNVKRAYHRTPSIS